MLFRWNGWNRGHIAEHAIFPADAEFVVRNARRRYPRRMGQGNFLVRGQTAAGLHIQVMHIFDPEDVRFVIHARPLTDRDKWQLRREQR